jgi:hypothetical protein
MIRDKLINAALGAVNEKTGQLLQATTDRTMQREMMDDAAALNRRDHSIKSWD